MTIIWKGYGDILEDNTTQVCPINAAGAMGAGLAKTMRDAYPDLWEVYRGIYAPGVSPYADIHERARVLTPVLTRSGKKVLLFCTKFHWRDPSSMTLIRDNLITLDQRWMQWSMGGVAMPLLGTGYGGLPRERVMDLIEQILGPSRLPVKLYLGHPTDIGN